ncbi:hypothetical protein ACVWZ3_006054 [Bradyrhizobium sp. i1.3.6]
MFTPEVAANIARSAATPDRAQPVHAGALGARGCEVVEERSQRVGTSAQEPGVHIAMRAVVDVADEPRLRIGLDFELQAQ